MPQWADFEKLRKELEDFVDGAVEPAADATANESSQLVVHVNEHFNRHNDAVAMLRDILAERGVHLTWNGTDWAYPARLKV